MTVIALLPTLANGNQLTPLTERDIVCRVEQSIIRALGREGVRAGAWICGNELVVRIRAVLVPPGVTQARQEVRQRLAAFLRCIDPERAKEGLIDLKWEDEEDPEIPLDPHAT